MTEISMSSSPELSPEEEKLTIRDISVAAEAQTKEGDTFYLITQRWWQNWLEYVNQNQATITNDGSSSEHHDSVGLGNLKRPSAIDNSDLIYDSTPADSTANMELYDTLVEGTDYILLPQEVWNQLYSWYGGGPTLARKVITCGLSQTELAVEVYPLRLQLHLMPKGHQSTIRISKKETIGELHKKACELFDLNADQVCIWDYFSHRKHALMNDLDKTLDDANIQMDQDVGLFVFSILVLVNSVICIWECGVCVLGMWGCFSMSSRIVELRLGVLPAMCACALICAYLGKPQTLRKGSRTRIGHAPAPALT